MLLTTPAWRPRLSHLGQAALALAVLLSALLLSPTPTAEAHPSLTRSLASAERRDRLIDVGVLGLDWYLSSKREKRYDLDGSAFPGWQALRQRGWALRADPNAEASANCAERIGRDCKLERWAAFLDSVRGAPGAVQIDAVNRFVNKVRYRDDQANWQAKDYWAAPGEFFAAGGDCEDYAVAKYYSLKRIGFPETRMKIVVLKDRRRGIHHAVLVVDWEGQALMLDSLDNRITPWSAAKHYRPLYSINETAYWLHAG